MNALYKTFLPHDKNIHQGDIFKSLIYYENYYEEKKNFQLSVLKFPHSIILTQECDLGKNQNERNDLKKIPSEGPIQHDKFLVSLLCAPLYNAEHLLSGKHLERLGIIAEPKNSKQKPYIKSNRDPRYHYMEFDNPELVPMIIDFKHYFTVTINYLENNYENRICSIEPIYRERISQRFSNFLSRIGLPDLSN